MEDIKLICFDLNKTLIKENSWVGLNKAMGMTKGEDDVLFHLWDEGIITYRQWQKILTRIYKKRGKATLKNIRESVLKFTYSQTAKETVSNLKDKGYHIALISGAMDILVKTVANELDIDLYEAGNVFVFDKEDYLDKILSFGEEAKVKVKQLRGFCQSLGIGIKQCACVGDGDNDIELFKITGRGITFPGSKIEKYTWKVIENLSDLNEIF